MGFFLFLFLLVFSHLFIIYIDISTRPFIYYRCCLCYIVFFAVLLAVLYRIGVVYVVYISLMYMFCEVSFLTIESMNCKLVCYISSSKHIEDTSKNLDWSKTLSYQICKSILESSIALLEFLHPSNKTVNSR